MGKKAKDVHAEVEHAREAGNFLEALKLSEDAFIAYESEGDLFGVGDILASRSITLRLLWEKTDDKVFLILAKHESMAGVEIARASTDKGNLIIPLFRMGQVQEELEEFNGALTSYREAISLFQTNPPQEHNRPAVLLDMQIRAAVCSYRNGDKNAITEAETALLNLESDKDEAKYNKDVWSSGGHMKIAQARKVDNPEKAKEHLDKAKDIIDSNPDLKLRKQQFEKLVATFK